MLSTIGALIGLIIAVILIIKKISPVYSLMLGALVGGLIGGFGLTGTVQHMITGVKDITPAIVRILAAGVLSGVLIKTGAAASIAQTIVKKLGERHVYLALALSAMLLTGVGVFIDVAVITVAPIALMLGRKLNISKPALLLAMIGGGKCGNVISPNPNTIIAAENFDAPLSSVMGANIIPAIIGLLVTIYVILPLMPKKKDVQTGEYEETKEEERNLPPFWASICGPVVTIILLALKPLCDIVIDPMIALPLGGIAGIIATRTWSTAVGSISYGLEKMSVVAVLLVGTGTLAGIIAASDMKVLLVDLLNGFGIGGVALAPIAGILMCGATASTTAGATIASASFAGAITGAGVTPVWGAAMVNSSATVIDHMPHGSFFHATGGSVGVQFKERMKLIPYESAVGLVLTLSSVGCCLLFG